MVIFRNLKFIFIIIGALASSLIFADCHPVINNKMPQYIVGYGSLIDRKSKNSTYPYTGANLPVMVSGYERGWFAKGSSVGFSTTYLGIIKNKQTKFNAVIFGLPGNIAISAYDAREQFYCRREVPPATLKMLAQQPLPRGQFWIYVSKPEDIAKPSSRYPLVQSYVDIFLSGCLEMQKKYALPHYAEQCIDTTSDWSAHWVNDRIYPRRPFQYQPNAAQIDKLLAAKMPNIFQQIRIE